MNNWMIRLKKR